MVVDDVFQPKTGALTTLKDMCTAQNLMKNLLAYPKFCDLSKTYATPDAKECLDTLASLALKERPVLVLVAGGPPQHICVLWGIELQPVLLTNLTGTNKNILVLS